MPVTTTWQPIVDDTASQLIAESDSPFAVTIEYSAGDAYQVPSSHDGIIHAVSVTVPVTANVEVVQ